MGKLDRLGKKDAAKLRDEMQRAVTPAVGRIGTGPLKTKQKPTLTTHEGAPAYAPKLKTELFNLAVSNMVGEGTFYEKAGDRDARFTDLVHRVAVKDPAWMLGFVRFLRNTANMRTASIVAAAEAVKARLDAKAPSVPAYEVPGFSTDRGIDRVIIDAALQRADEPGELLAYWLATYGRNVPKPVKRGLADAARRMYNEYTLLKYDTASHGVRFADVLDLVHPTAGTPDQGALFKYALDRRHGHDDFPSFAELPMIRDNASLRKMAADDAGVLLDQGWLKRAGMTWEDALSLAGNKVNKAAPWEAMIPNMGIMALIRNLRNFDEAGVSDKVAAQQVIARLTDPAQIAKSRQLPMRFLSAYRAAPSLRWSYALEQAITLSLANVPQLTGRTLIMVDTSSSMDNVFSKDGTLKRWDAAVIFGVALAQRCEMANVVSFSSMQMYWNDPKGAKTKVFDLVKGESLLKSVERWKAGGWFLGGGTDTAGALRKHYTTGYDRVVVLTDEQAGVDPIGVDKSIPATVPMYTWNLAGYRAASTPSGPYRHTFGGLTDAAFKIIPLLELGESPDWDTLFATS